jgi:glycosyltransferase involved in cell wall biosynthesis
MPLSILQAYASGVVVVSTNPGGIPHIVKDGTTGFLVPCGEADALAEAAMKAIADPALFDTTARNAMIACQDFAWEQIKGGWLCHYREAANARRGRNGVC